MLDMRQWYQHNLHCHYFCNKLEMDWYKKYIWCLNNDGCAYRIWTSWTWTSSSSSSSYSHQPMISTVRKFEHVVRNKYKIVVVFIQKKTYTYQITVIMMAITIDIAQSSPLCCFSWWAGGWSCRRQWWSSCWTCRRLSRWLRWRLCWGLLWRN